MDYPQLSGPTLPYMTRATAMSTLEVCFMDEFAASFVLLCVVFAVNWEFRFLKDPDSNYYVKQSLTALAIRLLIVSFGSAGPAINPMLATTWHIYDNGGGQSATLNAAHLAVYWAGPVLGALAASVLYVLYSGGGERFFGHSLQKLGEAARKTAEKKRRQVEKAAQSKEPDGKKEVVQVRALAGTLRSIEAQPSSIRFFFPSHPTPDSHPYFPRIYF